VNERTVSGEIVDAGAVDDFADGQATRIDVGDRAVAVVRLGVDFYALGDRCTHQDISLAEGDIDASEKTLECWKHGSAFSLETGEPCSLPATKPTPVYDVRVEDGRVLIAVTGDRR
jgi:3-phenylpropionate/trans-cinnamate dioxygenase ferredoxin subunit